jgi:hypothetical protein
MSDLAVHNPVKKFVSRYWWVILFVSLCATVYASSIRKKQEVIASLDQQLSNLESQTQELREIQQDLRLQIDSQSDPAWIQLTLMKVLGLVPEGQSKVYFYNEASSSAVR